MTHSRQALLFAVAGVIWGTQGLAHAQEASASAQEAAPTEEPKIWVGGQLGLSPVGNYHVKVGNTVPHINDDASAALEIAGIIDYHLFPFLSVGIAPAVMFNVKGTSASNSGTQVDLPLRIAASLPLTDTLRVYALGLPGYSLLFLPKDSNGDRMHPHGFMIGAGGGLGLRVLPRVDLSIEASYQWRLMSTKIADVDTDVHPNYLTVAVGLTTAL